MTPFTFDLELKLQETSHRWCKMLHSGRIVSACLSSMTGSILCLVCGGVRISATCWNIHRDTHSIGTAQLAVLAVPVRMYCLLAFQWYAVAWACYPNSTTSEGSLGARLLHCVHSWCASQSSRIVNGWTLCARPMHHTMRVRGCRCACGPSDTCLFVTVMVMRIVFHRFIELLSAVRTCRVLGGTVYSLKVWEFGLSTSCLGPRVLDDRRVLLAAPIAPRCDDRNVD